MNFDYLAEIAERYDLVPLKRTNPLSRQRKYIMVVCNTQAEALECFSSLPPDPHIERRVYLPLFRRTTLTTDITIAAIQQIEFACHGRHCDLILYPSSLENDERRFCLFTTLI